VTIRRLRADLTEDILSEYIQWKNNQLLAFPKLNFGQFGMLKKIGIRDPLFPIYGQGDLELFPFSQGSRTSGYDWDWINGQQIDVGGTPTQNIYIKRWNTRVQKGSYSAEFHIPGGSSGQHCKLFEYNQNRYPSWYISEPRPRAFYTVWVWFPSNFASTLGTGYWRLFLEWGDAKSGGTEGGYPTLNIGFQTESTNPLKLCNNNWFRYAGGSGSTKWNLGYTASTIPKERYVRITAYLEYASGFRILDGRCIVWIDGKFALERTDIGIWNYYSPAYVGPCWGIGNYGTGANPSSIWLDGIDVDPTPYIEI